MKRLAVSGVVIGSDFHFGLNRQGTPDFLAAQGAKHGFAVDIVPRLRTRAARSAPAIRAALGAGQVIEAAELLGYPWFAVARWCTAINAGVNSAFRPPTCGSTRIAGSSTASMRSGSRSRLYDGVANFGRRPMFDAGYALLEAFLFDFSGDLYGKVIDIAFIGWISAGVEI